MGGVVAAGTGDHRDASMDLPYRLADDLQMFLIGEGGGFPCGPGDNNRVGLIGYLKFDQLTQHLIVDGQVGMHRCNQCHAGTGKYGAHTILSVSEWIGMKIFCHSLWPTIRKGKFRESIVEGKKNFQQYPSGSPVIVRAEIEASTGSAENLKRFLLIDDTEMQLVHRFS